MHIVTACGIRPWSEQCPHSLSCKSGKHPTLETPERAGAWQQQRPWSVLLGSPDQTIAMMRVKVVFATLLIFGGCDPDSPAPVRESPESGARADRAICLAGEPFIGDGSAPVEAPAGEGAHQISQLRWEAHEGCERLVIDFADEDGAPAGAPGEVSAEVLRDLGVVRATLRDVRWVDPEATDATFDGPLATAAYAVWSPDGRWSFVDVHLGEDAEAHVSVLTDPARVVVDLRPGGAAVPDPAPRGDAVVVLTPRPGEHGYPLEVAGYTRTFEANVVVRLEQDGEDVYEDFTTATAWADAWGYYSFTVPDGPTGRVTLHVGDHPARDGTWEGAAVELDLR
jgi:hypothetical protein